MAYLARPRRPRRKWEWTDAKAVTFIVTLAARRSVTLAAARAGMSRKSAYALRDRDPAFAAAWDKAWDAGAPRHRWTAIKGNKGDEGYDPPVRSLPGDSVTQRSVISPDNPFANVDLDSILAILRDSDPRSLARAFPLP